MSTEPLEGVVVATAGGVAGTQDNGSLARDLVIPATPRPADRNPYYVYIASLGSPGSQRKMAQCLDQIACLLLSEDYDPGKSGIGATVPWEQLRYWHAAGIKAAAGRKRTAAGEKPWSPSYVNCCLVALRRVLREAWRLRLISAEDYQAAADVKSVKGRRLPAGRNIHRDEITRMLEACLGDDGPAAVRDAALIDALWSSGVRRAEAASARIELYDAAERSLKVTGKGGKERLVYLHPNAAAALERWLALLNVRSGPLFRPVDKWGNVADRHLTDKAIEYIVHHRRVQAGLPPLTPHDFRRTFIGDLEDSGARISQAQELAGHENVATTARYVRHNARALRAAVDRLPIPALAAEHKSGGDAR